MRLELLALLPPPPFPGLQIRPVHLADLDAAYSIESASYPADEAATRANLHLRITQAPDFFWGAFCLGRQVVNE